MPRNPGCTRCPLHTNATTVCVWGTGPSPATIMLVGEAPGETEDREGRPFVGPAGLILNRVLEQAGIKRDQIYITNIAKCRPPANRDPLKPEVAACTSYLAEEIAQVKPTVIIALGAQALSFFTNGKTGIKQARGTIVTPAPHIRIGEAKLTATYHPSYYLHSHAPIILDQIVDDLRFALAATEQRTLPEHHVLKISPDATDDTVLALELKTFETLDIRTVAVDVEWTAIQNGDRGIGWPWTPGTEMYSLAISGHTPEGPVLSVAVPWPPAPGVLDELNDFFTRHPIICHNAMADILWLNAEGIQVTLVGDTSILAYLMDEGQGLKLSQLASIHLGLENWKQPLWPTRPDSPEEWDRLLTYNADDTYATLLLHEKLLAKLKGRSTREQRGVLNIYRRLLLQSTCTFAKIAATGVPFDLDRLKAALVTQQQHLTTIVAELAAIVGVRTEQAHDLAASPMQTLAFLQDRYGLALTSSDKTALAPYAATNRAVALIQDIRSTDKLIHTYLEPSISLLTEQKSGRLHTIYRLTSTGTGRTSAELERGGSIQVLPRAKWVRQLIRARPGWKILSADQSQAELRIGALVARDETMLALLREGADLHKATAAFIRAFQRERLPVAEFWPKREQYMASVSKEDRQRAKGINFGFLFGMREAKFQLYARTTYGVEFTAEEAAAARAGYFTLYSGLAAWHERSKVLLQRGYTVTLLGRYRRYIKDLTQAINTPVQSPTSDIVLVAINEIDAELTRRGLRTSLLGFVHDNVLAESPDEEVEEVSTIIRHYMEHPDLSGFGITDLGVPLVADVAVGESWGDA